MSSYQPDEHFEQVWRALQQNWVASGDRWQDQVHDEFANNYWSEFERSSTAYAARLSELVQILAQARQNVQSLG